MRWSPQQERIFQWAETEQGSAIVEAVAGAGKTTTLIELVLRLTGFVALAAFNKAIAEEIKKRLAALGAGSNVDANTFHSFGYSAWRKVAPRVKMDSNKIRDVMDSMRVDKGLQGFVGKIVSLARQWGIGVFTSFDDVQAWRDIVDRFDLDESLVAKGEDVDPVELDERINDAIQVAISVLKKSCNIAMDVVDFDDMIYMPVLKDVQMFQRDWVLVDEAQDTNPIRLALAKKMLRPGGRLVAVGDPCQAIYGFSGADSDSLNKIAHEFNAVRLPLTVTYRCPKAIVAHARQWVTHIEAHESAPEGILRTVTMEEFDSITDLSREDAILCRNTAPIVSLAFALIRRRIACHVEGRDIGQGLVKLARRWKVKTVKALRTRLEGYVAREVEKFMAKGQETKAEQVQDRVATLFVIMDTLQPTDSVDEVANVINSLFGDTADGQVAASLTLSTVHRAKGREWNRVFLLGRNKYMPSKYARQDWQMEQENNLIYVAVTRAKHELVEVTV